MLGIRQLELSKIADVGISTVKRLELASEISGSAGTLWKLQTTLEKAGLTFIPADEHMGPDVRLKDRPGTKPKRRREAT